MKEKLFDHALFKERLDIVSKDATQKDIAAQIGISPATLSKWVNADATPSVNDLLNISRKYNCSVDYLLGVSRNYEDSKDITAKEFCSILFRMIEQGNLTFSTTDNSKQGRPDLFIGIKDKSAEITISYVLHDGDPTERINSSGYEELTMYPQTNELIIDFLAKLEHLEKVPDMPKEFKEDLIQKWLSDVEDSEYKLKHKYDWLKDLLSRRNKPFDEDSEKE